MRESGERRMIVHPAQHRGVGQVRYVNDDRSTVDVPHICPIRVVWINVDVVKPKAGVDGLPLRHRFRVADPRPWQPPTPGFFGLFWVAHIDDHVELIVFLIPWLEVSGAGGHVSVLAVNEPKTVRPSGIRPTGVKMRDLPRIFRIADVVSPKPCGLQSGP